MLLEPWQWLIALVAALLVGFSKTGLPGMGILAVALLAEVFPARQAVGAILPLLILGDLFAVRYYHKNTQWARLWELFPCVLGGMAAGFVFLFYVRGAHFKPFLGGLILLLSLLEMLRARQGWHQFPHRPWFTVITGLLAGFATTVGNVAGPIMNIYLMAKGLDKLHFMGTLAWYFFIFNCLKLPLYFGLGMINRQTLIFDLLAAPMVVVGALLGRWILHRISLVWFRRLVMLLAVAAAMRLLCG
ncbi:MAG: sulfite exporter TauE/SafE family protein [Kiritimatiellia bacterium]|nr:sulfite exporter TauE/SafE family protein [Lentisphaerota bacterium]